MGEWRVRLNWRQEYHSYHGGVHDHSDVCDEFPRCFQIVDQHQIQGPKVPEFTISVKWQDGDLHEYLAGRKSHAHGWRYVMSWPEGSGRRHVSGYGFPSEDAAREEAERKATKIVRAQQPEKVYKFTPEV